MSLQSVRSRHRLPLVTTSVYPSGPKGKPTRNETVEAISNRHRYEPKAVPLPSVSPLIPALGHMGNGAKLRVSAVRRFFYGAGPPSGCHRPPDATMGTRSEASPHRHSGGWSPWQK